MPRQKVPDIEFDFFVLGQIKELFDQGKIYVNKEYQRGDVWKPYQKIELIKSIEKRYSIGVLVLFINENKQYEILDGQQRLLTIKKYINDELDLGKTKLEKYSELDIKDKALIDAYCIYYLKLKSHSSETKEEDIVQTFLRLQEGTPLNKAEKINAYRGKFKETFRETRENHELFNILGKEKRFRFRQLAAELLLLELESDFDNKIFPDIELSSLINAIKKYEEDISNKKISFYKGNLDFLHRSLNVILTALKTREIVAFYILISCLRRKKADNSNLLNEFYEFAIEFLQNLYSFSMYDSSPPKGMSHEIFNTYKLYKQEAKVQTTSDSIKNRFDIVLKEFERIKPFIEKDKKRLFDIEQKRVLYFKQKGLCSECGNPMKFNLTSAHHGIAHSEGGRTSDLEHAKLMHEKCHKRLEKRLKKSKKKEA